AGITGFLGSQLAHQLVAQGDVAVIGLQRKTSNPYRLQSIRSRIDLVTLENENLKYCFTDKGCDIIVNCLANYGQNTNESEINEANLHLPERLLRLAVESNVPLFLNAGTSLPADVNAYSFSKNQFSQKLKDSAGSIIAIDAKLEHFFGAGENPTRFISFLIEKFFQPAPTLELTKGEQRRDFLHVDDVVGALCHLMQNLQRWEGGYHAIPLGSGTAYRLRDVVEMVRQLTGNRETAIHYGAIPYREREVMDSKADIRLLQALGWQPKWSLEAGLAHTIDEYRNLRKERISA
ncbi:MAG: NAD(P)-dependent oxidoreductase, partial [Planctomycetaceae bacterium]|nr:NAD(P)-dependent oxidoreductase [Planctomycetaceae bacterium]